MKYDTLAIQAFQHALEKVKKESPENQNGICYYILDFYDYQDGRFYATLGYEVIEWMRDTYFPGAHMGAFWWQTDPYEFDHRVLGGSKIRRICFLQRIIEDLMCGE